MRLSLFLFGLFWGEKRLIKRQKCVDATKGFFWKNPRSKFYLDFRLFEADFCPYIANKFKH